MDIGADRRTGLRAAVSAEIYFNVLMSRDEYIRGHASVLKRLASIDSIPVPPAKSEAQIVLSRIDQKLSLLVGMLADNTSRKTYIHQTGVMDLSEYGLSFMHSMPISQGSAIEIGLQLPMDEHTRIMDIAGTVVRVETKPAAASGDIAKYTYGVEFFDIQSKDQNDIIQWIFSHQRELIRRRRERDHL